MKTSQKLIPVQGPHYTLKLLDTNYHIFLSKNWTILLYKKGGKCRLFHFT